MEFPPTPALGGHRSGQNFFADMSGNASFVNGQDQSIVEGVGGEASDMSLIGLGGNMIIASDSQPEQSFINGGKMLSSEELDHIADE